MPIFLHRFVVNILEVNNPAVLLVPATLPHVVEHATPQIDETGIIPPSLRFVQNEPSAFDGMARIQCPRINVIDDLSIHPDLFHDTLNVVFHKLPNLFNKPVDLALRQLITSVRD